MARQITITLELYTRRWLLRWACRLALVGQLRLANALLRRSFLYRVGRGTWRPVTFDGGFVRGEHA